MRYVLHEEDDDSRFALFCHLRCNICFGGTIIRGECRSTQPLIDSTVCERETGGWVWRPMRIYHFMAK